MNIDNNFYLKKVFPEARALFEFEFKDSAEIKSSCLYIFDTNVLMLPFLVSNKGFNDYKTICQRLKDSNRLFIPARVAREFAKNRGENIKGIFRKLIEAKERTGKTALDIDSIPVLAEHSDFKRVKEIAKTIKELKAEYRDKIDSLSEEVRKWNWNDPVSQFYKTLWTEETIIEMEFSEEDLVKELKFRQAYRVAPGYKDSSKIDDGIGDLIIWQTILEIGRDKNNDVIFVTNEEKNDWFYNEKKTNLLPKFELFDEFRRISHGKSIAIISLQDFLTIQEAKETTIAEVKELRAPSGYFTIEPNVLLAELRKAHVIAKERDGFIGAKFFVETILANKMYDIASTWAILQELEGKSQIEMYKHEDPEGFYPPISAIRLL